MVPTSTSQPHPSLPTPHTPLCSRLNQLPAPQTGQTSSCLSTLPNAAAFAQVPAQTSLPPGSPSWCAPHPPPPPGSVRQHSDAFDPIPTLHFSRGLTTTCENTCLSHGSSATQWPCLNGSLSSLQQQAWCLTHRRDSVITHQIGLLQQRKYNHIVDSWGAQKGEGGIRTLPSKQNYSAPPRVTFPGHVFSQLYSQARHSDKTLGTQSFWLENILLHAVKTWGFYKPK